MKTTKEIAELISQEIERISKGEVRKDVIHGLEVCSNSLIKLARLEMDFAWKNWENQRPNVPWLATHAQGKQEVIPETTLRDDRKYEPSSPFSAASKRGQDIERQILDCRKQLKSPKTSDVLKTILTDKINHLQVALARAEAQDDEVEGEK